MNAKRLNKLALGTVSVMTVSGLSISGTVYAQEQGDIESIVVTGSRIVRDGFQAPTPVTVMGSEEFDMSATTNAADMVNTMPAFSGSTMPTATNSSMSSGASGLNALNLRSLGLERTLVLLDGRRAVASRPTGVIDVNTFPQQLIERVEVVTGGASAAYGADAVAGVVNFILDKDYEGFKSEVSGGMTNYSDNDTWAFSSTYGTSFASGRGHFLLSGESSRVDAVEVNDRPWNQKGWNIVANPSYDGSNGQPEYLVMDQVAPATGIVGGIITNTDLRGIAFGQGGTPYMFPYGHIVSDPVMVGGGWKEASIRGKDQSPGLTSGQETTNLFARLSYDLTDTTSTWFEYSQAGNKNQNWCCLREDTDRLVISTENAYLPPSVAAQAELAGITSFKMGSMNYDLGRSGAYNDREVERFTAGMEGMFDAFGEDWMWDAYYQVGKARAHQEVFNVIRRSRYDKALDSVIDPNTGMPACRVNTDGTPDNDDPLCVPYNIFGIGVNSPQVVDYILGSGARDMRVETLKQQVWAASLSGTAFDTWAGPVSIAAGVEHRTDKVSGKNDEISNTTRDWFYGNYRVYAASSEVTEAFVETIVPLAETLDLNAAARITDYEHSGRVTTWKAGVTWDMLDSLTFRGTVSKDIRAPSLDEMFSAGGGGFPGITNPFRGGISENTLSSTSGNPDLKPEESDYLGLGFVFQPSRFHGFSASIDYWDIDIQGAIETIGTQDIIDFCYDGKQEFCSSLDFGPNQEIELIRSVPFNLDQLQAKGIDVEVRYNFSPGDFIALMPGEMSLSYQGSHVMEKIQTTETGGIKKLHGMNRDDGVPDWRWRTSLSYSLPRVTANLSARGISKGVYDNDWIECATGCPVSTTLERTTNKNSIAGSVWFDTSFSYDFSRSGDGSAQLFLSIRNLFDKDPAVVAPGPGGYSYEAAPASASLYDTLGRVYRLGVRWEL